jgi:hypothetical protein
MKKRILILSFFLLASLAFVYIGCKKDSEDKDQRAAQDNSIAENAFNDVFNQVDYAAKKTTETGANKIMNVDTTGCGTISLSSYDTVTWPKTLTIDFGTTNCLCSDLKFRRGKIIATMDSMYRDSGTVITITLDQYYVNDYHIEGTKTITNMGPVGTYGNGGNLKYSVVVSNAKITPPTGNPIYWNSSRTREWIEGESTKWPNWQDDVYLIDGSANGTDQNGNTFTVTITEPLRVALNCKWIEDGTVEITPQNLATRTVDFGVGGGSCDNQASVTINGVTYPFTMN